MKAFACLHLRRQGHDRLDRHAHVFEFFRESTSGSEIACIKKMGEIIPRVSVDRRMNMHQLSNQRQETRRNVQNQSKYW